MIIDSLQLDVDRDLMAQYVWENWFRVDQQLPHALVRRRYPDVLPCLERVRELGLKTGVVSNISSEDNLRRELDGLELTEYFPVLVASGSVGFTKPAKEIFGIAIKRVQLDPGEIVFVGDANVRYAANRTVTTSFFCSGAAAAMREETERVFHLHGPRVLLAIDRTIGTPHLFPVVVSEKTKVGNHEEFLRADHAGVRSQNLFLV